MTDAATAKDVVRRLNDQMRHDGPESAGANRWVFTRGVIDLGVEEVFAAIKDVRSFDKFESANDPYGEHDFGSVELSGQRLFWKIDYYDLSLTGLSPNPADPSVTIRVLTLMLTQEY
jgi:hypothetical protein